MAKRKTHKAKRSSGAKSERAMKQVKDMIEDMREAGAILSDVARHFHHRVRSASHLVGKHLNRKTKTKKKHGHAKRRR